MCLAIPGKVVEIHEDGSGIVDYGGVRREADLSFVNAKVGDWVIVHAGFAIEILDEEEAKKTLDAFALVLEGMEEEKLTRRG